jgi:hypothetical protein
MAVRCVVLFGHDGGRPAVARAPPVSVGPASGLGWHGLWQYLWGLVSTRKTRAMGLRVACAGVQWRHYSGYRYEQQRDHRQERGVQTVLVRRCQRFRP